MRASRRAPVTQILAALVPLVVATWAIPTVAQDDEDLEEILGGFDDEPQAEAAEPPPRKAVQGPASFWHLSGALSLAASANIDRNPPDPGEADYRGLTKLKLELDLQLDLDLPRGWKGRIAGRGFRDFAYVIEGRSQFEHQVLEEYQSELEFQEVYLQGSLLNDLDLKLGRQVVNWDRSDNLRILDVLNPIDAREPGLVDIEDLLLPVTMTRVDYYRGDWSLTGIAVHEIRFDEGVVAGSEFYPIGFDLPEEDPANSVENTQYGLALSGTFSGWDVSFHAARYFANRPHVELVPAPLPRPPEAILRHSRLSLFGFGFNWVHGNWLVKGEGAHVHGLEFFGDPDDDKTRLDLLLGVEYSGFEETMVSLEVANRHIHGFESALGASPDFAKRNVIETALRYRADFWNQTLHATILLLFFGTSGDDGGLARLSLEYDLRDALTLGGGAVFYDAGDLRPFSDFGNNDRLYLSLRYSF